MIIAIILSVLAVGLIIIPFTGEVSLGKKRGRRAYVRGRAIIFFALAVMVLTWIQKFVDDKAQDLRDATLNNAAKSIDTLQNLADSTIVKVGKTFGRFDNLNAKLDSLDVKTTASVDKRNVVLNDFDRLNEKLGKLYSQENKKIEENVPNVILKGYVNWRIINDQFYIETFLMNVGGRATINFDFGALFLDIDSAGRILSYKNLVFDDILNEIAPATQTTLDIPFNRDQKNNVKKSGYLYLYFRYNDILSHQQFKKVHRYSWSEKNSDTILWMDLTKSYSDAVDEFIRVNKIELKTAKGGIFSL